jgi:hypothetical protein
MNRQQEFINNFRRTSPTFNNKSDREMWDIMEEHYRILKELDKRKMYHVRLIYNTNFSKLKFKDMDIFTYLQQ